jgi:nucleoside phosphorylase
MTGFCGGVPSKARLGDILLADMALDWDYGKWKRTEELARLYPRPEPISIRNSRTHRIARRFVQNGFSGFDGIVGGISKLSDGEISTPTMKLVPFASGSAVIGDNSVLDGISSLNDNIAGIDMESFAFYYACHHSKAVRPEFLCIKSVADDCGPDKSDRLHLACCYSSASVAAAIATEEWEF